MAHVDQETFEQMVAKAIDAIPPKYQSRLNNVAFVIEKEPNAEQRKQLGLRGYESLYGLYEGIPLTKRGAGYSLVLPDKITVFQRPIEEASHSLSDLQERVHHTVWHEVAHYFGLDHARIFKLEQ